MTFTSRKLLLIGAATAVMAQAAAADILKGTVTDASGEAALQGAIVTIEELGRTASSDRFGLGFLLIEINKRPGHFRPLAFNFGEAVNGRAARIDLGLDNVDKLVVFGVSRFGEGSLPGQSSLVSEKSDEFGAQGRITGIANRLGLC